MVIFLDGLFSPAPPYKKWYNLFPPLFIHKFLLWYCIRLCCISSHCQKAKARWYVFVAVKFVSMWCKYVSQFGLSSTQRFFCGGLPIVPRKSRHSTLYCGGPHECERPLRAVVLRIEGTERSILHLVRLKQVSQHGSSDYSGCSLTILWLFSGSSDYSGCSDLKTRDTAGAMPGCLSTIAHAQSPNCSTTSTTSRPTGSFASRFVFSSALSLH